MSDSTTITLEQMRGHFTSAVVCDALDAAGFPHQSPRLPLLPLTVQRVNGKATIETAELVALAEAKLAAAPLVRGGRRKSSEQRTA